MPPRFQFRFQTLLRVRKLQEDLKSQMLASLRRDVRRLRDERDDLVAQQRRMFEDAGHAAHRGFTAGEVQRYYQYERHLARLVDDRDAAITQLLREEEQALMELGEATKRKRIVERLRERTFSAHRTVMNKEEQKVTDEAATTKAAVVRTGRTP